MPTGVFDLFAKLVLDTSQYTSGLTNAKSLAGSIGSGIKKGFTALATAGAAAFTAASAATTKFVKDSVSAGMEFDKSMSQVAATMGKTVDQMMDDVQTVTVNGEEFTGNLREYALKMGSETAFSAKQAADALNYMALAGYDTITSMEMLPNVLNLAAAGTMDLATASDMVTDTQTAFGISLERTSQMVDEMAKAASTGNTSVQQLGDAFLVVGGLASELNGGMVQLDDGTTAAVDGVQELEIALTAMANAGIKGSEAGTHMRNLILRLSSPTSKGTKKLEEMGVAVFDAAGNMRSLNDIFTDLNKNLGNMAQQEKITTISELFNARDSSSAEALLKAVSQSWDDIGESILNSTYNFSEVNTAIRESGVVWEKYKRTAWMNNGGLQSLTDQIKYNLKDQKLSVEETADFIASEYALSMQDAQKAVQAVADSLSDAKSAAAQMADVQLDNLAGDITLFKSALEGAQIAISDSLSPALREFVQFGTEGVQKIADAFAKGGIGKAIDVLQPLLQEGISKVTSLLPNALKVVTALIDAVVSNLPSIFDSALPQIVSAMSGTLLALADQIPKLMPTLTNVAITVMQEVPKLLDAVLKSIPELIETSDSSGIIDAIVEFAISISEVLVNNASAIAKSIAKALPAIISGIVENIDDIIDALSGLFTTIVEVTTQDDGILDAISGMIASIVTAIADNADDIFIAIQNLTNAMVKSLLKPEVISKLASTAVTVISQVFIAAARVFGSMTGFGKEMAKSLNKTIEDVDFVGIVMDTIGAAGMALMDAFNLTEYFEIGAEDLMESLDDFKRNWQDGWDSIKEFVSGFWDGLPKEFTSIFEKAAEWGNDLVSGFLKGIEGKWNDLKDTVSGIAQGIKDVLGFSEPKKGPLSNFHTYAPDMIDLFVDGIKQNYGKIEDALSNAFSIPDVKYSEVEIDSTNLERKNISEINFSEINIPNIKIPDVQTFESKRITIPDVESKSFDDTKSRKKEKGDITINFTQNNQSPEALSEYENWRLANRSFDMIKNRLEGVLA